MWDPSDVADEAKNRTSWWCNTVVSLRRKALFVSIPKAACTKVRLFMQMAEGLRIPDSLWHLHHRDRRDYGYCHRLTDFSPHVVSEILTSDEWFRFSFVRNPYSRMVSAYQSKIASGDPQFMPTRQEIRGWPGFEPYRQAAISQNPPRSTLTEEVKEAMWDPNAAPVEEPPEPVPFAAFIEWACATPDHARDWHWTLQTRILKLDVVRYHLVGRLENFCLDAEAVLRRLGLDCGGLAERVNPSEPCEGAAYDARLATMVASAYRRDFELLQYDTESWRAI